MRLLSATLRDAILLMAGGNILRPTREPGNWLAISVEVTAPRKGFESAPALTGTGIAAAREPRGISADPAPGPDAHFLEYAARPAFVPQIHVGGQAGWVGLTKAGSYGGAGFVGSDDSLHFIVTAAPRLAFQKMDPVVLTLVFNVSGGQGHTSSVLAASRSMCVPVRAAGRSGDADVT
ncbi:MAG: hypothetical protein ACREVG_04435 [Burkholderiales bacterium]